MLNVIGFMGVKLKKKGYIFIFSGIIEIINLLYLFLYMFNVK